MTAILEKGPISRAGISRETGLSKQTSSEIVRLLEETGWIEETGLSKGKVGRSAVLYQIVPDSAYIVGVDLGGTSLTVALADMTGDLVAQETVPTSPRGGPQIIAQIAEICRRLAERPAAGWEKVRLAVVGTPGVVDPVSGFIEFAPNIPGFDRLRVEDELRHVLGIAVIVENDVNLAVIGERWRGAGQGVDDLVFIALGTGIGQGIMLDGKLLRGASGTAGEIGYLPLCTDPFTEQARSVGAFESAVGSKAILRLYRDEGGECETVRELFQRAEDGERRAALVLDEIGSRLALGVAATAALIDPEKVIFGGSIGGRPELLERIRRKLEECMRRPPVVEASSLGRRAGIEGALAYGIEELHRLTHGSGLITSVPAVPTLTMAPVSSSG
ncbi:MAG: ROK family transcriptional regulator [Trueperaceae bacterium]